MFSGTHKEYQIAEHVQAEMRAEADCCRLAHAQPTESSAMNMDQVTRFHFNWAVKGAVAILVVIILLIAGQQVFAQSPAEPIRRDPGNDPGGQPIADYREGRYYLDHGEYELAVEKFTAAIETLPEVLFQMPGYADMYWFLGEAQEGMGLYTDALVSYQTFLNLVGDLASPMAIEKVEAFSLQVNAMLVTGIQS